MPLSRLDRAIVTVARAHRRRAAELLAPLGLHPGQDVLLSVLTRRASASQAQLARILQVEPPTLAIMVRRLEASGFVERTADPGDGRAKIVTLTAQGRHASREADVALGELSGTTRAMFDDDEEAVLVEMLERIADTLRNAQ